VITHQQWRWLFVWLITLGWMTVPAFAAAADESAPAKPQQHHEDRNRLWSLISSCATTAAQNIYPPSPCAEVDMPHGVMDGYVVFKDRDGRYQYLVLPLARTTGIEDPILLAPGAPNYFADAWTARLYVEAALHAAQPREVLSMVVNSAHGRSQDQLHIHLDCIRPEVHDALQRLLPSITHQWRALSEPLPPHQHSYQAMWVDGETLSINPFQALASSLPAGDSMALHSLVVVGAYSPQGKPGFILLSGHVDPAHDDRGSGDELQDMDCAIAVSPKS
jgi:CDP-diacylglycerol pyrophosphatase